MLPQPVSRSPRRGFTLVELVIVVMIIGILATLLMPRYRQSVMKAQGADVATRVEAINVALKEYEADHDSLPTGLEPAGAPSWLVSYMPQGRNYFQGPSNITWQYSKTAAYLRATLIITAGTTEDRQILLAAAGALGTLAITLGGGSSLLVSLTE
jgi:prepilin-type N-terminal cleavage/methylation domain-containing protein